ncbi:EAL domain-containing protein [Oryzifoliimicrobium ureilyticus]|uniref:EAL domain-containing protein n=1 Tax=Oryzifoliimicrobium ureilyticus TaxID=3113724 RepID=UPI0030765FB2
MFLKLQNRILEMIASGESLDATLNTLCRFIEEVLPSITCGILVVEDDVLRHIAGPSLPAEYSDAVDRLPIGPEVGSCGSAAFWKMPVAIIDMLRDPRCAPYKALAKALGFMACWSSPIIGADGRVLGTFVFYYRTARGPSETEEKLVAASAHLCTIAIERHQRVLERHRLAYNDSMTGLPNRAAFDLHVRQSARQNLGLMLLDVDNLKFVNDTFGHRAGDDLIIEVANRLKKMCDHVFRVGGDEFAIICDAANEADLATLGAECLNVLKPPTSCNGHSVVPLATIGASLCPAGLEMETARHRADIALYHAKETARGRFEIFNETTTTSITRRFAAIKEVTSALAEDRLVPFYQPVIDLETGEIAGVEALCRIRRPDGVVMQAAEFFEATHDVHVASEITSRMLRKIGVDVMNWRSAGLFMGHVALNVTSADFQTGNLREQLLHFADAAGLAPHSIIVEVTESVYLEQRGEYIRAAMVSLRESGFQIAMDDFGTGYAALAHLLAMRVDIIKIDKSFTRLMERDAGARAIIEGLVSIAEKIGMEVVAEGVETQVQATSLATLGCHFAQGYLYSRAVSAEDFIALAAGRRHNARVA